MSDKVSIIVPCYNQAQYLPETLDSVLAQTYVNWECIIVNDGSSDDTENVSKLFCKKDKRFRYIYKKNGGVSSARNIGIKNSSGELILPLDSDDIIADQYLEKAIEHFKLFPNTKLVYCKVQLIGNGTGEWGLPNYNYEVFLFENMIFCSAFYKRKDYDLTNGYNEDYKTGLEDWDFWLTLLNENDIVYTIPEICFYYRIRDSSRTRSLTNETFQILHRKIYQDHKEKYLNYIADLIWQNPQIQSQHNYILTLENEIKRIHDTKAYKLGKLLLKPFNKFNRLIK